MRAIDFEYDGQYLSDYGFIICDFNFSSGVVEASAGSNITFNKVSHNKGKQYSLANTQYDECITTSFDICKNPDIYDFEEMEISNDEYRDIMRWLNRNEFLKFQAINDSQDDMERETCYYESSFNLSKIKIGEVLYGMRLTMETNKPFGYGQEQKYSLLFEHAQTIKILNDMSDEIGITYPTVNITCLGDGDLSIHNDFDGSTMLIKNCSVDEEITVDGNTQTIFSSVREPRSICNDFNYEFLSIGNEINNRSNRISVSLPCSVVIAYQPIIKDTPD